MREMSKPKVNPAIAESGWKGLYTIGGAAALIAGLVFRRNLDAEYVLARSMGIIRKGPTALPTAIADWFHLLQTNKLVGLTLLNVFDLINYALVGLIFLALCIALRRISKSAALIALALSFLSVAVYFATNQAFTMLYLGNQYAAAASEAQKAVYLAAGQSVLAVHSGATYQGMGLYWSFFLITAAGLIFSVLMLRSDIFNKVDAYIGMAANVFGLGYYIGLAFAPAFILVAMCVSAVFLLIWYLRIGITLLRIGASGKIH
jgi:hypothetical protein